MRLVRTTTLNPFVSKVCASPLDTVTAKKKLSSRQGRHFPPSHFVDETFARIYQHWHLAVLPASHQRAYLLRHQYAGFPMDTGGQYIPQFVKIFV